MAGIGSHWVDASILGGGSLTRRPALVIALVALLTLALVGGALLAGGRLLTTPLRHTYLNELVSVPDMSTPMLSPTLTTLGDGRVLVIGGGEPNPTALVYDPVSGASEAAGPMVSAGQLVVTSVVRLKDGRVLVVGDTAIQIFDPTTMRFAPVGPTVTPRSGGSAALLGDGRVLLTGGTSQIDGNNTLGAELFDPGTLAFSPTGSVGIVNPGGTATLPDGRVFVAEGSGDHPEIYDPSTGTFSAASTMTGVGGDPLPLPDGRVVLISGSRAGAEARSRRGTRSGARSRGSACRSR